MVRILIAPGPDGNIPGTALDYVIQSYSRTPELATCIELLLKGATGATTKYNMPSVAASTCSAAASIFSRGISKPIRRCYGSGSRNSISVALPCAG